MILYAHMWIVGLWLCEVQYLVLRYNVQRKIFITIHTDTVTIHTRNTELAYTHAHPPPNTHTRKVPALFTICCKCRVRMPGCLSFVMRGTRPFISWICSENF